jgi:hypothetical protein
MAKVKTSLSLERATLRKLKAEALRARRSVSQLVDLWIEEKLDGKPARKPGRQRELVAV